MTRYLRENYDKQVDFSALADMQAVSAPYLSKLFHDRTGTTPSRYLTELRMGHARKLLLDSQLSVKEIAERVGYPDPFHFSRSSKPPSASAPRNTGRSGMNDRGTPLYLSNLTIKSLSPIGEGEVAVD